MGCLIILFLTTETLMDQFLFLEKNTNLKMDTIPRELDSVIKYPLSICGLPKVAWIIIRKRAPPRLCWKSVNGAITRKEPGGLLMKSSTLMGQKICMALEHIERSLTIRNRRLGKKPIAIPKISEFTLGVATLERSCREFLDLEYFSKRQEMYQHYALLPYQRVASGRSLIFECTAIAESEQDFVVQRKTCL